MSLRNKTAASLLLLLFAAPVWAEEEKTEQLDESIFEETKPEQKKRTGKNVETRMSPETSAPKVESSLPPSTLQQIDEINAATALEEAKLKLETVQSKRLENKRKQMEGGAIEPPRAASNSKKQEEVAPRPRGTFPMPQGTPKVEAILGGNHKKLEASLLFQGNEKVDVVVGSFLDGGYMIESITPFGVTIGKNGESITIPVSGAPKTANRPWTSEPSQEPINQNYENPPYSGQLPPGVVPAGQMHPGMMPGAY